MGDLLRSIIRGTASLLIPPICPCCDGRVEEASRPCPSCDAELRRLWMRLELLPPEPGVLAALPFEGAARQLIHRLKYQDHLPAADLVGALMAGRLLGGGPASCGVLVPVPLHPVRQRERGYNQAERLARAAARRAGLAISADLLLRVRAGASQTSLEADARRVAVAGAFRIRRPPPPGPVILVDDVWTTGATTDECRRVLREGGVEGAIPVLVGARTPSRLRN